jgi:hypothetical protein
MDPFAKARDRNLVALAKQPMCGVHFRRLSYLTSSEVLHGR